MKLQERLTLAVKTLSCAQLMLMLAVGDGRHPHVIHSKVYNIQQCLVFQKVKVRHFSPHF